MRYRRTDVVERAIGVLDEHGLDALTMRRLAADLGVQPGALYHHFDGKDALLAAIAEEILRRGHRPAEIVAWDAESAPALPRPARRDAPPSRRRPAHRPGAPLRRRRAGGAAALRARAGRRRGAPVAGGRAHAGALRARPAGRRRRRLPPRHLPRARRVARPAGLSLPGYSRHLSLSWR
ncbi:TetR family transcriptional regulator [Nocardioides convexus]|uniref:TetR family transcriptional regulator n=1 Tax=Nocardioides convexus TaxID=2712224 RepID=UPI0024188927|nr:TetR family transcriptional regulator [Nocardioides convexus]